MRVKSVFSVLLPLVVLVMMTGCAPSYYVSVDAMSDLNADKEGNYVLLAQESWQENDLLFTEVSNALSPYYAARGMEIVSRESKAQFISRISFGTSEPISVTRTRSEPVYGVVGTTTQKSKDRRKSETKVNYGVVGYEDVPYEAYQYEHFIEIKSYKRKSNGRQGSNVWSAKITCVDDSDDFRKLLPNMVRPLSVNLGSSTHGKQKYLVTDDPKEPSVEAINY